MGYDGERCGGEIERCLREVASQDSLPLSWFDVMRPQEAWDELARRLRKPALAKKFLTCDAGEELGKAFLDARAARDPELKLLCSAAGLTAYVLPRRHPLRSTMQVIDPARPRQHRSASIDAFAA
jgi:hypothetical protein